MSSPAAVSASASEEEIKEAPLPSDEGAAGGGERGAEEDGDDELPLPPKVTAREESHRTEPSAPRYVILLDAQRKSIRLARCTCPRCEGYLTLGSLDDENDDDGENDGENDGDSRCSYDTYDSYDEEDYGRWSVLPKSERPIDRRGVTEEEMYEMSLPMKGKNAAGCGGGGAGGPSRIPPKRDKRDERRAKRAGGKAGRSARRKQNKPEEGALQPHRRRRVAERELEREAQLERKRVNVDKRVYRHLNDAPYPDGLQNFAPPGSGWQRTRSYSARPRRGRGNGNLASREQLGVEDEAVYRALMEIAAGRDITPEDYDALLQLDNNNKKQTMGTAEIGRFEIVRVGDYLEQEEGGDDGDGESKGENVGNAKSKTAEMCMVCLASFADMDASKELRRLPCGHLYCKSCIDAWLTESSVKCPELSCFWSSNEGKEKGKDDARGKGGATAAAAVEADAAEALQPGPNQGGLGLDDEQSAAVALFVQVTGADATIATEQLREMDFNLDEAVAAFFEG